MSDNNGLLWVFPHRPLIERSRMVTAVLRSLGKRQLLHEAVQEELKRYITENGMRPGDALPSEAELARQLGVGRNSVREAVKSLEALGQVLDQARQRGTILGPADPTAHLGLHQAIYDAIETRDPARFRDSVVRHYAGIQARIQRTGSSAPPQRRTPARRISSPP